MDSDKDYAVAKEIVQSGQSDEEWDVLRQGKGPWPEDERKSWKQYRKYSLDKLIDMMDAFKNITGITLLNPLILTTMTDGALLHSFQPPQPNLPLPVSSIWLLLLNFDLRFILVSNTTNF
jgi:hypothetical protein